MLGFAQAGSDIRTGRKQASLQTINFTKFL